jgi:transcriptional regulator with XRE-family HTH domain
VILLKYKAMKDRILQIMKDKGLQAVSFADTIGVSPGTISHILNGRNDPSKVTIDKILSAFPDISSSWLLSGEGPMYKHRGFIKPIQTDLFAEKKTVESTGHSQPQEYSQEKEVKVTENKPYSPVIQNINLPIIPNRKIDKIMIFYSDKTFMTFIPEE